MKLSKKIRRGVTDLAMVPLSSLEKKERNRLVEERLKRSRQKQKHLSFDDAWMFSGLSHLKSVCNLLIIWRFMSRITFLGFSWLCILVRVPSLSRVQFWRNYFFAESFIDFVDNVCSVVMQRHIVYDASAFPKVLVAAIAFIGFWRMGSQRCASVGIVKMESYQGETQVSMMDLVTYG